MRVTMSGHSSSSVAPGILAVMAWLAFGLMIGSSRPQNTSVGTWIPDIAAIFCARPAAICRCVDVGSRGGRDDGDAGAEVPEHLPEVFGLRVLRWPPGIRRDGRFRASQVRQSCAPRG
jgi:hypothetical protein